MADTLLKVAPPVRTGRPAPVVTAAGVVAAASGDEHTGGMVALIPAAEDAEKLAVEGGTPPEELHLTLAYLGDDVTGWDQQVVDAVQRVALELTDPATNGDTGDLVPDRPGQRGPLTLTVFSHGHFNPDGDEHDPCMVYQFSGEGDLSQVEYLGDEIKHRVREAIGDVNFPEQHSRFEPHVTAGFGLDPDTLSYTGPVVFDRLRVALGGETTDYPLGGSSEEESDMADGVTAAVSAKQREKAEEEGDTYPGTSQFPIATRDLAKSAVRLYGNSDLPAEKVKAWLKRRLKAKGWEDLIPDAWKDDSVKASAELDDTQREAIVAAATAMVDKLGAVGAYASAPLVFTDPQSLEVADGVIELPADDDALTASADGDLPPAEWFERPADLPLGTGHYVDGRRVYGRLAEWSVPHIGASGQQIYPPRSKSGYRWFHTKTARVQGENGPERIKIGHLTFGTGHASTDPGMGHLAAAAHYDNSGYRGAKIRVGEDEHGIWYAGALCSGVEGAKLEEFEESDTSGDWRRIMGHLELVGALCVNVGGFPKIGMSMAASGEPLALVASAKAWGNPAAAVDVEAIADAVVDRWERRQEEKALVAALTAQRDELLAELDDTPYWAAQRDALVADITGNSKDDQDDGDLVEVGGTDSDRYTW